jgi:putative DNA primase/helicase
MTEETPPEEFVDKALRNGEDKKEVDRLSKLTIINFEREREEAAKRLGVRKSVLDKVVAAARPANDAAQTQGRDLEFPASEPWPEPLNGAALLDEIEGALAKFIVCEAHARVAMALWTVATWFEPVAQVAPILNIASPVMRCGKSTALSLIGKLAKRPLSASSISPAAVFRAIEKYTPTLIIDEVDAFLNDNDELRGVINSGHTRDNAFVIRTTGEDHEPELFATWGFKAVAGIGKRAATIEDRGITIPLERKLSGEKIARLRHTPKGYFETLARQLCRFASDNLTQIEVARPAMPEELNDRAQDNWEPLLAIADAAGEQWPQKARAAALALSGAEERATSSGEELLHDIRAVLAEKNVASIASDDLVNALIAMADRPWGECNRGKPITQNGLARMLKEFRITTKNVGPKNNRRKGYEAEAFESAFIRYLPPDTPLQGVHPHTTNEINYLYENQSVHPENGCTVEKSSNSLNLKEVCWCTAENPQMGAACDDWEEI